MKIIQVEKDKNYILATGSVIDASRGTIINGTNIYVENGLIKALVNNSDGNFSFTNPRRELVRLDLNGCTVLPPLVDCHVHLALDGKDFTAARRRWEEPDAIARQVQSGLEDTLSHGILAVRDGGDRAGIAIGTRDRVTAGKLAGPVIKAPGLALRKPGTYGSFLGPGVEMQALDKALDNLVQKEVNHIKVIVSGLISFTDYGQVGPVQYTGAELAVIVQGAHDRGLPVMAHASSDAAVRLAVEAGVDTVEHGYFLSRDTLALIAEKGVAWIPTVIPVATGWRYRQGDTEPDRREHPVLEKIVERQLAMINEAISLGVTLGVGTDSGANGVEHGPGYKRELALYHRAGLGGAEIIRCATLNGARILGLDWGGIEPGRPAAMIAVAGNPLANITVLEAVQYIILPR